jgi:hypothetical protein
MPASNGHDETRLDRIEAALEALVRSQSHLLESQSTLEQGHKDLLRSQVLMQDELRQFGSKAEARFQRIETKLEEATDKINGLIDLMDRHLRDHREGRA